MVVIAVLDSCAHRRTGGSLLPVAIAVAAMLGPPRSARRRPGIGDAGRDGYWRQPGRMNCLCSQARSPRGHKAVGRPAALAAGGEPTMAPSVAGSAGAATGTTAASRSATPGPRVAVDLSLIHI